MPQYGQLAPGQHTRFGSYDWPSGVGQPGDHQPYILKVDGVAVDNFNPIQMSKEFSQPMSFYFSLIENWDMPSLIIGTKVEFWEASHLIFRGTIYDCNFNGQSNNDGIIWNCLSLANRLNDVYVKNLLDNHSVVYNPSPNEPEYAPGMHNYTCGQIIREILNTQKTELAGFIDHWIDSELNAMTIMPPRMEFAGITLAEAFDQILQYQYDAGWDLDPNYNTIHFRSLKKTALTVKNLDASTLRAEQYHLKATIAPCITRVILEGREEIEKVDRVTYVSKSIDAATSDVTPGWDQSLENSWDQKQAEDDPQMDTFGKVYKYFWLSNKPLLPSMIASPGALSIMQYDPYLGESGNWINISGKANLKTGLCTLTAPYFTTSDTQTLPNNVFIRYAYLNANTPKIDTGYQGEAYTDYGWQRPFIVSDPDFKRQYITGRASHVTSDTFNDMTSDGFSSDLIGCTVNGGAAITAVEGTKITAPGHGLSYNDEYSIEFRNDLNTGMALIAQALLDMSSFVQFLGEVVIDDIFHMDYQLGSKINILNTNYGKFTTLGAPLRKISWNYQTKSTVLHLTSGYWVAGPADYAELKRRFLRNRSKVSAQTDIASTASQSSGKSTPTKNVWE